MCSALVFHNARLKFNEASRQLTAATLPQWGAIFSEGYVLLIFIHLRFHKIFIKESFWTQPLQLFLLLWQKLKCQRKSILQIPNYFSHWQCEKMLIEEVNSIKSNLQTYKLHTLVKQFWLNLPYPNSKQFSNFQIDIFWHFKFCHDRRNGFYKSPKIDKDSKENTGARKWECHASSKRVWPHCSLLHVCM